MRCSRLAWLDSHLIPAVPPLRRLTVAVRVDGRSSRFAWLDSHLVPAVHPLWRLTVAVRVGGRSSRFARLNSDLFTTSSCPVGRMPVAVLWML